MTDLERVEAMLRRAGVSYVKETHPGLVVTTLIIQGDQGDTGCTTDWIFNNSDGSLHDVEVWNVDL